MKKQFLAILLSAMSFAAYGQEFGVVAPSENSSPLSTTDEWKDPTIVAVGKEAPRANFMTYTNRDIARDNNYEESDWYISLNGKWDFGYWGDYRKAPVDNFYAEGFDTRGWYEINVPGNWEVQGFGTPIYTNAAYEFQPRNPVAPTLPDEIPVGLYRRTFDIPLLLRDRDIFLTFDGIKGGTTVYINGKKVGYTEDSKTKAEFRINDYVTEGTNTLAVEVMRWGTGNYLECQDFWRLSGFERDVYIWSQPSTRIDDFKVVATLDSTYTHGLFDLEIALKNSFIKPTGYMQVWFEIEDENKNIVDYSYVEMEMAGHSVDTVRFHKELKNVKKWSAETPNLYSLVLKVKKDGRFIEYTSSKIGFRTTEVVGRDYLVNGKRVLIKGTNYHEHDELTGHYLSEETIKKDMELMKKANINAIRTSHYPQGRRFYELADKYGFYIVCEANIESHGMGYNLNRGGTLANDPVWLNAHMDRTMNMYEQYKNYPSVVIWSLGNEAGNGYNFYKTYQYLKDIDTLRPVQYERAVFEWNTDIFCPMYPPAETLRKWANEDTDRPYIACEYSHAMGNSNGGISDMWDAIYDSKALQGGFIWDWVDQGLLVYNADSTDVTWCYGGDFTGANGENMPSDGNFLANGLVSADRTPHPALLSEVKKAHQSIRFKAIDLENGKFEVKNYYDFLSTGHFKMDWRVKQGSRTVSSGVLNYDLAPMESKVITLTNTLAKAKNGEERFVEFSVRLKADEGLLKKGYEVASEQFVLPATAPKVKYSTSTRVRMSEDSEVVSVSSPYFMLAIDKKTGFLSSYDVNGTQYIDDELGLRPLFWRAATDNDYGADLPIKMEPWRGLSNSLTANSVETRDNGNGTVSIEARYNLAESTKLCVTYTVHGNGAVHVGYDFTGNPKSKLRIGRLGMRMRIPEKFSTLNYFGRGPAENYCDRKSGSDVDLYTSNVSSEAFDYIRPQETGHHTDTRYLSLTAGGRNGIAFIADNTLEFNALKNTVEDFDGEGDYAKQFDYQWNYYSKDENHDDQNGYGRLPRHTHSWDITEQPFVEVCLDYRHMGLAGSDSWGYVAEDQYHIFAKDNAKWGFTIVPIKSKTETQKLAKYNF